MERVFIAIILFAFSKAVVACSCGPSGGFEEAVKREYSSSSFVALAMANSIEELKPSKTYQLTGPPIIEYASNKTKFTPLKIWKGRNLENFYTELDAGIGSCWGKYTIGKVYILFLMETDEEGVFTMDACSFSGGYTNEDDKLYKLLNEIHLTGRSSGTAPTGAAFSIAPVAYVSRYALHSAP